MKISSIDIAAFGKFKDFHLDFNDGMTVILGENEKGKTTIMAFIRMMFYGNSGKSSDLEKNPRKKYRPWNSDIMAGSITFTHGGNLYRLEREFKASNSTDKITLLDMDTGKTSSLSGSEDIGAKFFGLTDGAFERSVFLEDREPLAKSDSAYGEINSRLSNIATVGDEDISFEKVGARLQKAKESLFSKRGKIGKCDKAQLKLEELNTAIFSAKEKEDEAQRLKGEIRQKESLLKEYTAESSRLFDALKNADKMKKRIFVERYIEGEKELRLARERLKLKDGSFIDSDFISKGKSLCTKTQNAQSAVKTAEDSLNALKAEVDRLETSVSTEEPSVNNDEIKELYLKRDELDGKIETVKANAIRLESQLQNQLPVKKPNPILILSGLFIAIIGIALMFVQSIEIIIPVLTAVAGITVALLGLVFKIKTKGNFSQVNAEISENSQNLSSLLDQKQSLNEQINSITEKTSEQKMALAAKKALLESKKQELLQKEALLNDAKSLYSQTFSQLLEFISVLDKAQTATEIEEIIASSEETLRFAEALRQKISLLADHANCKSLEEAEMKLEEMTLSGVSTAVTEQEVDEVKERFQAQTDLCGHIRSEIAALNARLKALAESTQPVSVLIREKEELENTVSDYYRFANTADLALETLEEAFRELRRNYSGTLEQKTSDIFKRLVGDKYTGVSVSKDFNLNVTTTEAFGLKESAYLSLGTEDQLYLALRLAVSELMTQDSESLPMFMDDPLSAYDDTRAKKALEFLNDYSKNRQFIMFTCHDRFADMAKENNINIQLL